MRTVSLSKALIMLFAVGAFCTVSAGGGRGGPPPEPRQVTLFSRITYKDQDYGRSAFNFRHGLRSDDENWVQVARNDAHLMYGSISFDPGTDWFSISAGGDDASRIKDLGGLQWSEAYFTPVLYATPRQSAGIKFPGARESFEESSDGRVTKVIAGHMYLVHIKNREADLYAMFRVEALEPNHHCMISWRVVLSPEE
jgi:hypothetical protein